MLSRNLFRASVALAALALATPVLAQEGSEAQADPSAADTGLTDIIVTAQRREENLQRAALPVSAVTGDVLVSQSITRADDLTRLVPALQVAPASSFTQIYLRGERLCRTGRRFQSGRRLSVAASGSRRALLRPGAYGGAERAAGHALWPQCIRRRRQPHHRQAEAGRSLRPR